MKALTKQNQSRIHNISQVCPWTQLDIPFSFTLRQFTGTEMKSDIRGKLSVYAANLHSSHLFQTPCLFTSLILIESTESIILI